MRHVSKINRPLKTSTVASAIQSDALAFCNKRLSSDVPIRMNNPTVKKLPQARKSRRLTHA